MAEDFKRDKQNELIRKFEAYQKDQESHYFDSDSLEEVINHYINKSRLTQYQPRRHANPIRQPHPNRR